MKPTKARNGRAHWNQRKSVDTGPNEIAGRFYRLYKDTRSVGIGHKNLRQINNRHKKET